MYCQSKVRWRFRKILWPSQNMWTLPKLHWKNCSVIESGSAFAKGTIPILRQHIFGLYWRPIQSPLISINSTERQQKLQFFGSHPPTHPSRIPSLYRRNIGMALKLFEDNAFALLHKIRDYIRIEILFDIDRSTIESIAYLKYMFGPYLEAIIKGTTLITDHKWIKSCITKIIR